MTRSSSGADRGRRPLAGGRRVAGQALAGSELAKAAGLAGAMIANNVIALGATIVFARLLPDSHGGGYGSLAALVSYFLILSVFGQALQVATAREGVLGHLGVGPELVATARRWSASLLGFTAVLAVISVLVRVPIADAVGVRHDPWAAAMGLPAAGLWLWLCTLAGALQGVGEYRAVSAQIIAQQAVRLPVGAALAAAGLGVFGAYAGSSVAFLAAGAYCLWRIERHGRAAAGADVLGGAAGGVTAGTRAAAGVTAGTRAAAGAPAAGGPPAEGPAAEAPPRADPEARRLLVHLRHAWAPILGLIVVAVLQNIDVIAAKHRFTTDTASSYSAVAVAAKVLIWVSMGAGFYLVPEVTRRRAAGQDPRPVLARALGIVGVCAVPVLLIYAFAAHPLIRLGFGAHHTSAAGSLLVLGLAFTVLATTYLAVQYLLALHRTWFLGPLIVIAVLEPILLLHASRRPTGFAAVVLVVQLAAAVIAYGFAVHGDRGGASADPLQQADGATGAAGAEAGDAQPSALPEPIA